jgi:hypothetical protein
VGIESRETGRACSTPDSISEKKKVYANKLTRRAIEDVSPLYSGQDFSKKTEREGFLAAFINGRREMGVAIEEWLGHLASGQ